MFGALAGVFGSLLILGFPIFAIILIAVAIGIMLYTNTSPTIMIQQLFNGINSFVLLAVPLFIISGNIAAAGDTAKNLVEVLKIAFGRVRGGLAIATIIACAFFAAISGSALACVVAIGTIMIPIMVKEGYPRDLAIGLVTATGTLGILIPPSIPMIVICVTMNTSVAEQFMAGFLPGVFIALIYCLYIYFICKRHHYGAITKIGFRESTGILKKGIWALLFPVIILGSIYGGFATPTEAAAVSVVYVLIVELFIYKKVKIKAVPKIVADSAVSSGVLCLIIACATTLTWLLTIKQGPGLVSQFILANVTAGWQLILILIILLFILGCFMDIMPVILILGPILLPTLQKYDINLIHFGILAIVCIQVSMITPPFGMNLFVAMDVTKEPLMKVAKATFPYMLVLAVLTFVIAYWPQLALVLPDLIYGR